MRMPAALDKIRPLEYSFIFGNLLISYLGRDVLVCDVGTALNVILLTFTGICNSILYGINSLG